jgi:hypothetical protein
MNIVRTGGNSFSGPTVSVERIDFDTIRIRNQRESARR